jgi:hypothetical protein
MTFKNMTPPYPDKGGIDPLVTCFVTGVSIRYSDAVERGWMIDIDGPPFQAYYSPAAYMVATHSQKKEQEKP